MKPTLLETDPNAEHLTELWKHWKTHLKKNLLAKVTANERKLSEDKLNFLIKHSWLFFCASYEDTIKTFNDIIYNQLARYVQGIN